MTKCRKWCWLALWAVQAATARAQVLPIEQPPVPPDTEAVERERAAEGGKPAPRTPAGAPQQKPPADRGSPAASKPAAQDDAAAHDIGPAPLSAPGAEPAPRAADSVDMPAKVEPKAAAEPAAASATEPAAAPAPQPPAAEPAPLSAAQLWSAGALFGMGVTFDHTIGGVNPLGFGFGVRGDYLIAEPFAVGARMLYFVGGSSDLPDGRVSMQSWLIAAEGSAVLKLDPLVLQPGLLFGLHVREIDHRVLDLVGPDVAPGNRNKSQVGLYLSPGLSVNLPFGQFSSNLEGLFAGMDVRLDLVLGSRVTGNLQLLFQAGIRF